jgi:hypothetical protein
LPEPGAWIVATTDAPPARFFDLLCAPSVDRFGVLMLFIGSTNMDHPKV